MNMDEESFVPTGFTKNRKRLIEHDVASRFFGAIVEQARAAGLIRRRTIREIQSSIVGKEAKWSCSQQALTENRG